MGKRDNSTRSVPTTSSKIRFPPLSPKTELECRAILENQILVIEDIFSPAECKSFVKFIDGLPLELTPPKKRGEAERHNHRFSVTSTDFAQCLHELFAPHLPAFLPSKNNKSSSAVAKPAHSFNSNIRVYKYTTSQYFGPHYDDDCRDAVTGARSEWTLLIYLSGQEDGVRGGETLFYRDDTREVIKPPLTRGTALLHRHGRDCMLHEGSQVTEGVKYVLRSDIMFL